MKTWVISNASEDGTFIHFWTPRGLTAGRSKATDIAAGARRAKWDETIIVQAPTYQDACNKAFSIFMKRRVG